jgi:ABC-type multidrug transport system fused ATPase/permease subunit
VTEADPETQRSDVAEETEDQANQPGRLAGTLLMFRDIWRLLRGEDERARKVRWLVSLLRPYRLQVILMTVALLIATAAALAPPYLAGRAIDSGIQAGDESVLTVIVAIFIGSVALYWAASYAQTYLVGWVGQRALQDLRERIYVHVQKMSIGFFTRRRPGVLISRMTNDVQALDSLVTDGVVTLFSSTLTLVGVVVILLALDVQLALVTFITFPLLLVGSLGFRIASAGAYRLTREKIADITAYLQETLSGIRVVRTFGREDRHVARMTELNESNREVNLKTVYLNAAYFPAVELLSAIGTAAIILYGGYQAIDGQIALGVVVAFIGYLAQFFDPIQQISQLYTTYQQGMAALDKIFELLDTEPDMVDAPDAIDPGQLRGEIELDDVWFSYARGGDATEDELGDLGETPDWALEGIDLHVPAGQTVALVGETGAGKSTLAKLVARFYDPQRGRLLVDGHDLRELRTSSLRGQLGIVPQEGFLFSGSVRENIAFGRPEAEEEEILAAARAVGAVEFIERLPDGFDTEVGERGSHLSAGQRQLVAFARALLAEPRILILDEATSNIDVRTERVIEHGLERLLSGRTAIVIAHRLSTIRRAGRIIVLEHGRIAESGTHEELIDAGGRYAELYGSWAESTAA